MKKLLPNHVLRGVMLESLKNYASHLSRFIRAGLPLVLLIALARFMTTDYTGDQYALIITLISALLSMVLARIAVNGWDTKKVKLLSLYNALMGRYISTLGLFILTLMFAVPVLGGFLAVGVAIIGDLARWSLIFSLPLLVFGFFLALAASFALFALMDDMQLTVIEAFRVSFRLTRKFLRPVAILAALLVIVGVLLLILVSAIAAPITDLLQDLRWQVVLDAVVSLLVTPLLFSLWSRVYNRMVEAYE
jgi:hypothetical protein